MRILKSLVFFCFISILPAGVVCADINDNLIRNGDFEETDTAGNFKYFTRVSPPSTFLPSADSVNGIYSAAYTSFGGFVTQSGITLKPGAVYRLTAWIKTDMGPVPPSTTIGRYQEGALVQIHPKLPGNWTGPWPRLDYPRISAGGGRNDWKKFTEYFRVDEKFSEVLLRLYVTAPGTAWFDDISLVEVTEEEMEKWVVEKPASAIPEYNLVNNGSFELASNPDFPDGWDAGIGMRWYNEPWDERAALVEGSDAVNGKKYLRMKSFRLSSMDITLDPSREDLVLSFWARSRKPSATIRAGALEWKTVTVTGNWERYVIEQKNEKGRGGIAVHLQAGESAVDIDGVQLEYGSTPSDYNFSEMEFINNEMLTLYPAGTVLPGAPETSIPLIASPLEIDGRFDEKGWKDAAFIKDFHVADKSRPKLKTEALVCRDDRNLYIGFICSEENMDRLVAREKKDEGFVWLDDSVGVVVKPWSEGGALYIFWVNSGGVKTSIRDGDRSWSPPWSAAVYRSEKEWQVEIAVPLAILCEGLAFEDIMGLNLIRNVPRSAGRHPEKHLWAGERDAELGKVTGFLSPAMSWFEVPSDILHFLWQSGNTERLTASFRVPQNIGGDWQWAMQLGTGAHSNVVKGDVRTVNGYNLVSFRDISPAAAKGASVVIISARTVDGNLCYFRQVSLESLSPVLDLKPPRFSFVFEKEANPVRAELNITDTAGSKITFRIEDGKGREVHRESFSAADSLRGVRLNENLPAGNYFLTALAEVPGDKTIENEKKHSYRKLSASSVKTQIDRWSNMVVRNGKPLIPMIHSVSGAYNLMNIVPDFFSQIAGQGFNSLFVWSLGKGMGTPGDWDVDKAREIIRMSEKAGLPVIFYTPRDEKGRPVTDFSSDEIKEKAVSVIESLKDEPGIFMWHHFDEIYGIWEKGAKPKKEPDLADIYNACVDADPYRLHYNNSWISGRLYGGFGSTDIINCTSYTLANMSRGVPSTVSNAARMKDTAELGGGVHLVGIWMQYYARARLRYPSADDLQAMVYGCLAEGARVFGFWTMRPLSDYLWESTGRINREIESLTPVIYRANPAEGIRCSSSSIKYWGGIDGDTLYLVTVNNSYQPVRARFNLGVVKAKSGKLLFEERGINIDGLNGFSDLFKPLERHVYKFTMR